jgi:hypothetical protein
MPNDETWHSRRFGHSGFGIDSSFVIRLGPALFAHYKGNALGLVAPFFYQAFKGRNRMKSLCEIDFVPPFQGLNLLCRVSQGAALGCHVMAPSAPQ